VNEGSGRLKVRLACIDAPETSQAPYRVEARRARQGLLPIGAQVGSAEIGRSVAAQLVSAIES